jgi:ferredoxin--NADP+ reductase
MINDKYTVETITWIKPWTHHLFSFKLTRPKHYRFQAGQWARLGVLNKHQINETMPNIVWRAYSIVSSTYDDCLEFYSIVVPAGEFTSNLALLKEGDDLYLDKQAFGFLTLSRFETPRLPNTHDLWLLSTGTGLAPFLSMLNELPIWEHYQRIILVHGVRYHTDLSYGEMIQAYATQEHLIDYFKASPQQFIYQPCITRDTITDNQPVLSINTVPLLGRISTLIQTGILENTLHTPLNSCRSHVMLCGNPDMVSEVRNLLKSKGLTISRTNCLGNIAVENYW